MFAVRFQHGVLSRGGRRRNSPPGNTRAEGFRLVSFVCAGAFSGPRQRESPARTRRTEPAENLLLAASTFLRRQTALLRKAPTTRMGGQAAALDAQRGCGETINTIAI